MKVVVLVPRRADNGWRDELWRFTKQRWERDFPDWPIVEGHHNEGLFNRSAAINEASRLAGDWDVALIIDSDTISDRDAVRTGADVALSTGCMVTCHDLRIMLTDRGTKRILKGYNRSWRGHGFVERIWYESCSSAVAVSRQLFDRVGGFDERFVGWGREDSAFRMACETFSGKPMLRVASAAFHLWHEVSPSTAHGHPDRVPNEQRFNAYEQAVGDITQMSKLTGGVL